MSAIWSWVYQGTLLLVATFVFMVIFQYGVADFPQHAGEEFDWLAKRMTGRGQDSSMAN